MKKTKLRSKEVKRVAKDPGQKTYDSTAAKGILDSTGAKVSDPAAARKELVENLLYLLQTTVEDRIAGMNFLSKIDLVENHVHDLKTYASSLRNAANAILTEYPAAPDHADSDQSLEQMADICDSLLVGSQRVEDYINEIRNFGNDLDNMKSEIHNSIVILHQEI